MRITHESIAKRLGLSRITVTKILNREPGYRPAKETKEKVFRIAKRLGYDFRNLLIKRRRRYTRIPVNMPAEISIFIEGRKKPHDRGRGIIKNISKGGALLSNVTLNKGSLPLKALELGFKKDKIKLRGKLMWIRTGEITSIGIKCGR